MPFNHQQAHICKILNYYQNSPTLQWNMKGNMIPHLHHFLSFYFLMVPLQLEGSQVLD